MAFGKFFSRDARDPRTQMDALSLAAANRNDFPIVAGHKQNNDRWGTLAAVTCALGLGVFTFWAMSAQRHQPHPSPTVVAAAPVRTAEPAPVEAPPPVMAMPAFVETQPKAGGLTDDRVAAPALVIDNAGALKDAAGQSHGNASPLGAPDILPEGIPGQGAEVVGAARMTDPSNTISQGTMITAVLETAINSDLPGYARAIVSKNVQSFDGSRVLIPRASHLIGQYKSGLSNGQTRVYVLWTRLIRPDGVSIALASPGTDSSGQSGMEGDVNTHFFSRFGSALLLSAFDMLSTIGNASVILSGGQGAASTALQRDGQVPPTVTVLQGTPINIFTARDLDFTMAPAEAKGK